jgi:CheY-like chemotaxis protein
MVLILIVEDDLQNAALVQSLAQILGYTSMHALNGEDGWELLQQTPPDLVVLDMRLPGRLNGWEFARLVRQQPQWRGLPILAFSVPIEQDDEATALAAGCTVYLPKPCDLRDLRDLIVRLLSP